MHLVAVPKVWTMSFSLGGSSPAFENPKRVLSPLKRYAANAGCRMTFVCSVNRLRKFDKHFLDIIQKLWQIEISKSGYVTKYPKITFIRRFRQNKLMLSRIVKLTSITKTKMKYEGTEKLN